MVEPRAFMRGCVGAPIAATFVAASACELLVSTDDLAHGPAATTSDASDDAGPTDAGDDAPGASDGAVDDGGCPATGRGPAMLSFAFQGRQHCIDTTEVTNDQYAAFVADTANGVSGQDPSCTWNLTFKPCAQWPAPGAQPVTCVDICDARAFCAWAGKRLCGSLDGGPVPYAEVYGAAVPAKTTWYMACSHDSDSQHDFPYGNVYDWTACNGGDPDASGPDASPALLPVGSLPTCEGGFPGLFDMSGNAGEWEDACEYDDAGQMGHCVWRGGNFTSNGADGRYMSCGVVLAASAHAAWKGVGFRCCSP